jgi:hypothetical protein
MKRELPDDLARLGLYLEAAAGETLRRRRRRGAMVNFIGKVSLAVPLALAVAAADLSPSDGLLTPPPAPISFDVQPSANTFVVRQIPAALPPRTKELCFDAQDCSPPAQLSSAWED